MPFQGASCSSGSFLSENSGEMVFSCLCHMFYLVKLSEVLKN